MARPNWKPRKIRLRGGKRHPGGKELLYRHGTGFFTRFVPLTDDQLLRVDLPLYTTLEALIDGKGDDEMVHDLVAALLVLISCAAVMKEQKEIENAAYNALDNLAFAHTAWKREKRVERERLEKIRPVLTLYTEAVRVLIDRRDFLLAAHRHVEAHLGEFLEAIYAGKRPTIRVTGGGL